MRHVLREPLYGAPVHLRTSQVSKPNHSRQAWVQEASVQDKVHLERHLMIRKYIETWAWLRKTLDISSTSTSSISGFPSEIVR